MADMVQPYHPVRADQHISTPLMDVIGRLVQLPTFKQLLCIYHPAARPPEIKERSRQHVIVAVYLALFIDQKWPFKAGLRNVQTGKIVAFEGNYNDLDIQPVKISFLITQLRDVRPAWKSAKMAVKHHEQPAAAVVGKMVELSPCIGEIEAVSRCVN